MEDSRELFDERNPSSGSKAGVIAANSDILLVQPTQVDSKSQDGKVETIAISCTSPNWFSIVVRPAGTGPGAPTVATTKLGPLRLNADGLLYIEENFKDPIFNYDVDTEIAIVNHKEIAAGVEVGASMKTWERRV